MLSDLLGGVVVCVCCRIYCSVWLFALAVGLVGGAGVSAFRHDTPAKPRVARVPKARTEPWVNTGKSGLSSVGAALSTRAFAVG